MMDSARNPELQRLLDNLSSYVSPEQASFANSTTNGNPTIFGEASAIPNQSNGSAIPGLGFLPPEKPSAPPLSSSTSTAPKPRTSIPTASTPKPQPPPPTTSTPVPDASMITTWPAALKHVTKHLALNETFADRIRHLISSQHKHESQWYDGRTALMSLQSSRSDTSAQVSALLHSLGGRSVEARANDQAANEKELEAYDKKVYAGLMAMAADFDKQLRGLGVPFYAIKHELVILEEGKEKAGAMKGRLDKGELRDLQKRMLQLLEDLFGE